MNKLTQTLLTGAALCALLAAPVMAQPAHPAMQFTALHEGRVVNKTKLHVPGAQHVTYTFGIYTTIEAERNKKVPVAATFYRWNSTVSGNYTLCSNPKQKVRFDSKKTLHGKVSAATETYSFGCPSGPTTYYGADYKLTNGGGTDHFRSILIGKFKANGNIYKGTLNMDVGLNFF